MRSISRALVVCFAATVVTGCAQIEVVDAGGPHPTGPGVITYPSRPFLLVEKGEKGTTAKVISLPDISRPRLVRQKGHFGTTDMNLTLDNGMIVTAGAKADSKTAETITALTGGFASIATGMKTAAEAVHPDRFMAEAMSIGPDISPTTQPVALKIGAIDKAQKKLQEVITQLNTGRSFDEPLIKSLTEIREALAKKAVNVTVPEGKDVDEVLAEHYKKNVARHIKPLISVHGKLVSSVEKMKTDDPKNPVIPVYLSVAADLSAVVGALSGLVPSDSPVQLYRIDFDGDGNFYFTPSPLPFVRQAQKATTQPS